MINTINVNKNKAKFLVDNELDNIFLLPKWEKIKTCSVFKHKLPFFNSVLNLNIFRKFSSKYMLEKYKVVSDNDIELGKMDLRIYKDCVYIININIIDNQAFLKLVQTAVEKALYNTTDHEVKINLNFSLIENSKIKKLLLANEFTIDENQSEYEKEMFGETLKFKMSPNSLWKKQIKQNQILLDK